MKNIFDYKYLSPDEIKGFNNYKYSSIDNSPLAVYISHPFWNQIVKLYPSWLAPNVLTFGGMLLVMLAFSVVSYYDYFFLASSNIAGIEPIPNWVWLFCSLSMLLAHIMDGTDGKQARKIGACGPTGELFDHGIDSWLTVPFTVTLFSVFGRLDYSISAFRQLLVLMSVQIVFFTTHWEKYNTGVLFLSWCYDASQYGLAVLYFITWAFGGYMFWKFYIPFVVPITPANIMEFMFYISCFGVSIPMSLNNIIKAYKTNSLKQENFYEAMVPSFSPLFLFFMAIAWSLLSQNDVLNKDPRAYYWSFGTIFSNIACRLIVAQMTATKCQTINWLACAYASAAVTCVLWPAIGQSKELLILRLLAIFVTFGHVHYTVCVIRQMCDHFNINCFTVKGKFDETPDSVKLLSEESDTNKAIVET